MRETFDISHIDKEDMKKLAEGIEEYFDLLEEIIVIPKELQEKHDKTIRSGISFIREDLIKKLKKGKRSVFKDEDEWDSL